MELSYFLGCFKIKEMKMNEMLVILLKSTMRRNKKEITL